MPIEPLSTIIAWVIGICVIIFFPVALVLFIIFFVQMIKEL